VLIERIFKNPKTTILGLLIIALCFVLVWGGRATLTEVSTFMVGAFALMFLKDPKDGKAAGGKPKDQ
jgi:Na+/alanine symporter